MEEKILRFDMFVEKKKVSLDKVGKEDKDINNDGKMDKKDSYLEHRRKVIAAAIEKKKAEKANESFETTNLDMKKDQHLMSIRSNGQELGHVEILDGKIVTNGQIGENRYDNFVDLIRGLQGHDIKIDDFFF